MKQKEFNKFVEFLSNDFRIFGPVKDGKEVALTEVKNGKDLDLSGKITLYPFKYFFIPPEETLFYYEKDKFFPFQEEGRVALFGMTIFDLSAINLYNHVFEKDPYYQKRLQNILTIGVSSFPEKEGAEFFIDKYEEDILEHIPFDIFFGVHKRTFRVFSGSEKGRVILESFGYKNYEHIQFAGPIKEEGKNPEMMKIREKMKKHFDPKIWEELGKICLSCGRCSLFCPTCFCFGIEDEMGLKSGKGRKKRSWSSCFYQDFSLISGGHKFLDTTAKRIHNWYYHKFVRIPDEYGFPGCTGCGRCTRVCPVGINIRKILEKIKK